MKNQNNKIEIGDNLTFVIIILAILAFGIIAQLSQ